MSSFDPVFPMVSFRAREGAMGVAERRPARALTPVPSSMRERGEEIV
jgi:hypothetical protein